MCGFTGFIDFSNNNFNYEYILNKCHKKIIFRGPDENKKFIDYNKKLFISFERLSFLDLSERAMQPLLSKNKRYLFLFNGEIYNYSFLNSKLKKIGLQENNNSDSIISIEYISNFGINNFLKSAKGMFGIVLIDFLEKKVSLISDSFLQKPVYYSNQRNVLYFSSDLRTIHAHNHFDKKINRSSLGEFFKKSFISSPNTIYEDVYKLNRSCIVQFSFSNNMIKQIENISYNQIFTNKSDEIEYSCDLNKINEEIENSVMMHLESDVPIGTFLSGGIDSALITSIAKKFYKNIESFSLGFNEKHFDESNKARELANYLNIKHHIKIFDNSNLDEKVINTSSIFSEPFSDSSQIPYASLCEFTSSKVKGVLSGDGGDEIFGGYHRHLMGSKIFKLSQIKITKKLLNYFLNVCTSKQINDYVIKYADPNIIEKLSRLKFSIQSRNIEEFYQLLTSHPFFKNLVRLSDNSNLSNININESDPSKYMMKRDLEYYLPNDLMVKSDRSSMFYSLEVRSPFLDFDLAHKISRLHKSVIFSGNTKKKYFKINS